VLNIKCKACRDGRKEAKYQILADGWQFHLCGIKQADIIDYANTILVEGFGTEFALSKKTWFMDLQNSKR
jgi:hypothetical protein